jgi:hypothetical protein
MFVVGPVDKEDQIQTPVFCTEIILTKIKEIKLFRGCV